MYYLFSVRDFLTYKHRFYILLSFFFYQSLLHHLPMLFQALSRCILSNYILSHYNISQNLFNYSLLLGVEVVSNFGIVYYNLEVNSTVTHIISPMPFLLQVFLGF